MTVNYRCTLRNQCGARKTLRKPIELYKRRPLCPGCGRDTLASVNTREKARNKERCCKCDGYPFPHHTGTVPWCCASPIMPTDDDYRARYG